MVDWTSVGGLLWRVRHLVVGERPVRRQFECRLCGYSTSHPRQRCPECGTGEIASYEL